MEFWCPVNFRKDGINEMTCPEFKMTRARNLLLCTLGALGRDIECTISHSSLSPRHLSHPPLSCGTWFGSRWWTEAREVWVQAPRRGRLPGRATCASLRVRALSRSLAAEFSCAGTILKFFRGAFCLQTWILRVRSEGTLEPAQHAQRDVTLSRAARQDGAPRVQRTGVAGAPRSPTAQRGLGLGVTGMTSCSASAAVATAPRREQDCAWGSRGTQVEDRLTCHSPAQCPSCGVCRDTHFQAWSLRPALLGLRETSSSLVFQK